MGCFHAAVRPETPEAERAGAAAKDAAATTTTLCIRLPHSLPDYLISAVLGSKAVTTVCIVVASSNSSLDIPFERNNAFTVRVKN